MYRQNQRIKYKCITHTHYVDKWISFSLSLFLCTELEGDRRCHLLIVHLLLCCLFHLKIYYQLNVVQFLVIRVGPVILGYKSTLYKILINSSVILCSFELNKPILKSPCLCFVVVKWSSIQFVNMSVRYIWICSNLEFYRCNSQNLLFHKNCNC